MEILCGEGRKSSRKLGLTSHMCSCCRKMCPRKSGMQQTRSHLWASALLRQSPKLPSTRRRGDHLRPGFLDIKEKEQPVNQNFSQRYNKFQIIKIYMRIWQRHSATPVFHLASAGHVIINNYKNRSTLDHFGCIFRRFTPAIPW